MIERILADGINANVKSPTYLQVLTSNGDCVKDPKKDSLAVKAEVMSFFRSRESTDLERHRRGVLAPWWRPCCSRRK